MRRNLRGALVVLSVVVDDGIYQRSRMHAFIEGMDTVDDSSWRYSGPCFAAELTMKALKICRKRKTLYSVKNERLLLGEPDNNRSNSFPL